MTLPGKREPLTPQQRLDALQRVQDQAEQRIALGKQLFKAAEARMRADGDVLKQVRREQEALREQLHREFAESLHSYDQWVGKLDENFTNALRGLERRIDAVVAELDTGRQRIDHMLRRAESLLAAAEQKMSNP